MGHTLIERIIILTSPVGLLLLFIGACIHVWSNHVWCSKRWYFLYYDYKVTVRAINKGLSVQQKKNLMLYLNRNPKHLYSERLKKKLEESEKKNNF